MNFQYFNTTITTTDEKLYFQAIFLRIQIISI